MHTVLPSTVNHNFHKPCDDFFPWNSLEIQNKVVSLHSEISPLQLKGYVDVAHSCRLYGAVSVL